MRVQGRPAAGRAVLLVTLGVALLTRSLAAADRSDGAAPPPAPGREARRDREGLRRLLEDLAYEPAPGDFSPLDDDPLDPTAHLDEAALRDARRRVALDLRGAIAAMTSQDRTDYLAGRHPGPDVLDLWVWLPEPRLAAPPPAAEATPPPPACMPAETPSTTLPASLDPPTTLGDPADDGLRADRWGPEPEAPYRPVRIVPQVAHGQDGHTRSVWLRDPDDQARRFLEHQARNAALGGRDWLRTDDDERRAPLPPLRDASGHTISRYAGGAPTREQEDAILRGWGEDTLERLEHEQAGARAPRPLPSAWDTIRSALRGGRR